MENITILFLVLYFLPTGIALIRNHPYMVLILVINIFFGWTCIGWLAAFIWALSPYSKPAGRKSIF